MIPGARILGEYFYRFKVFSLVYIFLVHISAGLIYKINILRQSLDVN